MRFLSLFFLLPLLACDRPAEAPPPNVVLLLADDLGYNDLSCYRALHPQPSEQPPTSETPHLDRLAGQGMLFTNFYAGAAVCSPSRAALITGRNATRTGIYNWIPGNSPMHLRDEEVTIAELLQTRGYATGHFGKWHLTSPGTEQPLPNDQGFDYSFYAYNNAEPSHKDPENYFRNGEALGKLPGYACQLVVDEAIGWLERRPDKERPFYLNVWFNEPHVRLAAPSELTARHDYHPEYYGAIENMDGAVGRLIDYLEAQGLAGNTIVLFSSDNGSQWAHSNDPLRGEKCFNYEGGLRAPFLVRWPGRVPAGAVRDLPGSFTDVLPSLAELTGAAPPAGRTLDGVSLAAVWQGAEAAPERQSPIFFFRYFHDPICMLREGDWCLLGYQTPIPYAEQLDERALANLKPEAGQPAWSMWGFQPVHMTYLRDLEPSHFELYNLHDDPQQRRDLAADQPERVARMKKRMLELRAEMVAEGGDWFAGE